MQKRIGWIILVLMFFLLGGCGDNEGREREGFDNDHIKLIITKNFGTEEILTKEIEYQSNISVMDLLFTTDLEIEAGYSGSFIDGINGLVSKGAGINGERQDWFYFVNGVFADVGALDYFPGPGDIIWWDYRPWKTSGISPTAVIGSFPETFKYSYLGKAGTTYIMSYPEDFDFANHLKSKLEAMEVKKVEVIDIDEKVIKNPQGPTILLGQWDVIKKIPYVQSLNENFTKTGFYGQFSDNDLNLLDPNGKPIKTVSQKAGLLMATGQGNGDANPLWIVTGIDQEGFREAVKIIIENHEKIFKLYNACIIEGQVFSLPLLEKN